jgi:hypothetical protein
MPRGGIGRRSEGAEREVSRSDQLSPSPSRPSLSRSGQVAPSQAVATDGKAFSLCTGLAGLRDDRWRVTTQGIRRTRTQELAGSSPASSTSRTRLKTAAHPRRRPSRSAHPAEHPARCDRLYKAAPGAGYRWVGFMPACRYALGHRIERLVAPPCVPWETLTRSPTASEPPCMSEGVPGIAASTCRTLARYR